MASVETSRHEGDLDVKQMSVALIFFSLLMNYANVFCNLTGHLCMVFGEMSINPYSFFKLCYMMFVLDTNSSHM